MNFQTLATKLKSHSFLSEFTQLLYINIAIILTLLITSIDTLSFTFIKSKPKTFKPLRNRIDCPFFPGTLSIFNAVKLIDL